MLCLNYEKSEKILVNIQHQNVDSCLQNVYSKKLSTSKSILFFDFNLEYIIIYELVFKLFVNIHKNYFYMININEIVLKYLFLSQMFLFKTVLL